MGGGTPSLLPVRLIEEVLKQAKETFPFALDAEVSLEINPETVSLAKLKGWRSLGINRLSFGFQSLRQPLLTLLGRQHSSEKAISAFKLAREVGFSNLNVDLIYGIPGELREDWQAVLEQAVQLNPEHISLYPLKLSGGAPLRKSWRAKGVAGLSPEDQAEKYHFSRHYLKKAGYKHYEISNFCRIGRTCRHNLAYWRREDYLGVGAGAHSLINNRRFFNLYHPLEYVKTVEKRGEAVASEELVGGKTAYIERLVLGLRLIDGLKLADLVEQFPSDLTKKLNGLEKTGLVQRRGSRLFIPKKFLFVSNQILQELV